MLLVQVDADEPEALQYAALPRGAGAAKWVDNDAARRGDKAAQPAHEGSALDRGMGVAAMYFLPLAAPFYRAST